MDLTEEKFKLGAKSLNIGVDLREWHINKAEKCNGKKLYKIIVYLIAKGDTEYTTPRAIIEKYSSILLVTTRDDYSNIQDHVSKVLTCLESKEVIKSKGKKIYINSNRRNRHRT